MMAERDGQERSEQATQKRREEAHKKGQVPRSREVTSAALILGSLLGLHWVGSALATKTVLFASTNWSALSAQPMSQQALYDLMFSYLQWGAMATLPILFFVTAVSVAASALQHGWVWATPIDWKRVDPFAGFGRLFSVTALVELLKTLLKFFLVVAVSYFVIRRAVPGMVLLVQSGTEQVLPEIGRLVSRLMLWCGLLIGFLAVADYLFQRWEFERSLMMSRQELKEELRQTEGDPMLRARIRRIQKELARKRMMVEVPKAQLVITNPTRLAVALMYEPGGRMHAPRVLAKGSGYIAQKIREIAEKHQVPVITNQLLARALYKSVKVGEYIPSRFYVAVAEILAYVFRIRGKLMEPPAA